MTTPSNIFPPEGGEAGVVTQADRDAAARYASTFPKYSMFRDEAPAIRAGKYDDWEVVKAFARHRTASSAALVSGMAGCIGAATGPLSRDNFCLTLEFSDWKRCDEVLSALMDLSSAALSGAGK